MALNGRRVTITTSATQIDVPDADNVFGRSIAVTNGGAAAVDLGDAGVTSGAGYSLDAGATISLDLQPGEVLYGIAASGTVAVHVIETGV